MQSGMQAWMYCKRSKQNGIDEDEHMGTIRYACTDELKQMITKSLRHSYQIHFGSFCCVGRSVWPAGKPNDKKVKSSEVTWPLSGSIIQSSRLTHKSFTTTWHETAQYLFFQELFTIDQTARFLWSWTECSVTIRCSYDVKLCWTTAHIWNDLSVRSLLSLGIRNSIEYDVIFFNTNIAFTIVNKLVRNIWISLKMFKILIVIIL